MRILYFGYLNLGHHLYDTRLRAVSPRDLHDSLNRPDGTLTPYLVRRRGGYIEATKQPQGHARLHHLWGWSVVAWWDRTGDRRLGSNSAFLVEHPKLSFDEVITLGAKAFPSVWQRQTEQLVEVNE